MRMYFSVFRIRFINNLQYRVIAFGEILARFTWAMMEILAFSALYRTGAANFPMEFSQTVSYLWLQETFLILFSVVYSDGEIYQTIRSGTIAYELVRPMSLYGRWFCQSAANRLSYTAVNCAPVILAALLMPKPYGLTLPASAAQMLLFFLSAALALGVVVAFAMLMYISLFYLISQRGIKIIVTAVTGFLSGGVIPLPFFPEPALKIVRLLPFAAMQNMPLLIFNGSLTGPGIFWGIAFQIFWLAALVSGGRLFMNRALKKVTVQGG